MHLDSKMMSICIRMQKYEMKIYTYMCVCVCLYMCVYICVCVFIHTYTQNKKERSTTLPTMVISDAEIASCTYFGLSSVVKCLQ